MGGFHYYFASNNKFQFRSKQWFIPFVWIYFQICFCDIPSIYINFKITLIFQPQFSIITSIRIFQRYNYINIINRNRVLSGDERPKFTPLSIQNVTKSHRFMQIGKVHRVGNLSALSQHIQIGASQTLMKTHAPSRKRWPPCIGLKMRFRRRKLATVVRCANCIPRKLVGGFLHVFVLQMEPGRVVLSGRDSPRL